MDLGQIGHKDSEWLRQSLHCLIGSESKVIRKNIGVKKAGWIPLSLRDLLLPAPSFPYLRKTAQQQSPRLSPKRVKILSFSQKKRNKSDLKGKRKVFSFHIRMIRRFTPNNNLKSHVNATDLDILADVHFGFVFTEQIDEGWQVWGSRLLVSKDTVSLLVL